MADSKKADLKKINEKTSRVKGSGVAVFYLHVIVGAEDHAKAHVNDAHNHRHLHLVGVEKREAVGGQVPNLLQTKKKGQRLKIVQNSIHGKIN